HSAVHEVRAGAAFRQAPWLRVWTPCFPLTQQSDRSAADEFLPITQISLAATGSGGVLDRHFLGAARGFFNLEEPQNGFAPDREHSAGEPSVGHERPVERH